uniref:Glycosyltransferase family 2 protein n=2 Tax=Cohnella candidum TaxID=2674991 RepID=A0A3G3K0Z0_9BACL|nr:glycosyltransferase family 2 protein [Cohnella candidum]
MEPHSGKVAVLLSVYNGEKYLRDFLDSLVAQTFKDFVLWVRDDGSADHSVNTIREYQDRLRIDWVDESSGNLGVKRSFDRLLAHASSKTNHLYFMFADQDDIWLPHKIRDTLAEMRAWETRYPGNPILIHTDLSVCNETGEIISDSFWRYQKLNPDRIELNRLLVQNVVTGCTMMLNRPLAEIVRPIPQTCIMHDWWIALAACGLGRIGYLGKSTILYRQHGSNTIGAKGFTLRTLWAKLFEPLSLTPFARQALCFYDTYGQWLSEIDKEQTDVFSRLPRFRFWQRVRIIRKYRFYKHGFLRTLNFILKNWKLREGAKQ